ncbi:MAG: cold-shock protein [Azospirillum sp.]|nr:cold-shock protein [Azospirillum sp.]
MFPDRRSSPRQQSTPEVTRENVSATVKWFNAQKGFGFVSPSDGSPDAFLHASVLNAAGYDSVADGTSIVCDLARGTKGPQVAAIHDVNTDTAVEDVRHSRSDMGARSSSRVGDGEIADGTVKWYKPDRGFGFVAPDGGGKDVFVHATALERSGIDRLDAGQRVRMTLGMGVKGPQAERIVLI